MLTRARSGTLQLSAILARAADTGGFAEAHGHPDIVVNPLLVFNVVLGMSVEDNSEIGGPFVGVGKLTWRQPVYPGDTITARSTTKAARLSASNPANGIVTWLTEGFNQRDERVIDFERSNLVRLRHPPDPAPPSGEGGPSRSDGGRGRETRA